MTKTGSAMTFATMTQTAVAKIQACWGEQVLQGFLAGGFLSLGAMHANLVEAGFEGSQFASLSNLVGGAVFPVGLIGLFLTGANLFTGNCMYVVPAVCQRSVSVGRAAAFLLVSFLSNFAGAFFVAYMIAHQAGYFDHDPYHTFVKKNAERKCAFDFGVAVLRGVGANWLVCLAWWQALATKPQDILGKIVAIWWPVFTFTSIGFEHSIANMFYVSIGLLQGAEISFGKFLFSNLLPVTIGNFLGGSLFLGFAQYITHTQLQCDPVLNADADDYAALQGYEDTEVNDLPPGGKRKKNRVRDVNVHG